MLTRALALVALALPLTACLPLDGKAERHLMTTEAAPAKLEISSRFLEVDVSLATDNQVSVKADVYLETTGGNETAEREIEFNTVHVIRDGDRLVVRQGDPNAPWRFSGNSSAKGKIAIALPANMPLVVKTASGDVALTGDFGNVAWSLSTASGEIDGKNLGVKSLDVSSASGDASISVVHCLERLSASLASGDIELNGGAETVSVETASGDITLRGLRGDATVSVASGDVTLAFDKSAKLLESNTTVKVSSASGDVTINLPSDVQPSGSVTTASGDFAAGAGLNATIGKRSAKFNGSGAKLTVSTASGDVRVQRAN